MRSDFKTVGIDVEENKNSYSEKPKAWNEKTDEMFSVSLFNVLFSKGTSCRPPPFLLVVPKTGGTRRIR